MRRPSLFPGHRAVVAAALTFALSACDPAGSAVAEADPDPAADEAAVRALFDEVERSENEKDLEAWRKTITDDVLFIAPTGAIQGSEPLHAAMAAVLGAFDLNQSHTVEGIQVSGDLAEMWGRFSDVRTPRGGGDAIHLAGTYFLVARRGDDGAWRVSRIALYAAPVTLTP